MSDISGSYYSEIMRLAPLGYWPLSDIVGSATAADVSGNGRNGTVSGSVTFGEPSLLKGDIRPSALFGGNSTDYVALPTTGLPSNGAPITMMIWLQSPFVPPYAGNYPTPLNFGTRSATQETNFYFNGDNQQLAVGNFGLIDVFSSLPVIANHVYFLVATNNGTTTHFYCYDATANISDVQIAAVALRLAYGYATIGTNITAALPFNGYAACAAFLGSVLTADQIARLYHVGSNAGILRHGRSFGRMV